METEFIRGSSSYTRIEIHVSYKTKYCHKVFDFVEFKARCAEILYEVAMQQRIVIKEMGFDGDHVHMDIVIRNTHRLCDVDKAFKGTSGKKLLKEFPQIKRRYFWGSGLWGSQDFGDSIGRDRTVIENYVKNQGKNRKEKSLMSYVASSHTASL